MGLEEQDLGMRILLMVFGSSQREESKSAAQKEEGACACAHSVQSLGKMAFFGGAKS